MAEFKGTREAFAAALYEMAAENDKVVGVFPDSLKAMRAVPFGGDLSGSLHRVWYRRAVRS